MYLNKTSRRSPGQPARSWIRQSFFLGEAGDREDLDLFNRFYSYAEDKYVDTSFGGARCMNPLPQYSPATDPRAIPKWDPTAVNRINNLTNWQGLGYWYSDSIEDTQQIIHIRFGMPKHNSLTTYLTGFYNSDMAKLARTGRVDNKIAYYAGRAFGYVVLLRFLPITLMTFAVSTATNAVRFLSGKSRSSYVYLNPTMPLYWTAVSNIVNEVSTRDGLIKPAISKTDSELYGSDAYMATDSDRQEYATKMPDIFRANGSIDIPAFANKAMRRAIRRRKLMEQAIKNGASVEEYLTMAYRTNLKNGSDEGMGLNALQEKWLSTTLGDPSVDTTHGADGVPDYPPSVIEQANDPNAKSADVRDWSSINTNYFGRLLEFGEASLNDGNEFANFRVEYTGPAGESFTNSVQQSEIQSKINGMSASSRSAEFSLGGGNIVGGAVGAVMGQIKDAVGSFLTGALDSINVTGLFALAGSAYSVIPQHWMDAQASLPRMTYKMRLVSHSGNPYSRLMNVRVPLAMVLAGALPLATGPQSYQAPFHLELYDRGHAQTRYGIITDLSIERGVSNLGFTLNGEPLAVDVSFTVIDMTNVMMMPITRGSTLDPIKAFFDDDSIFTDYMNILAAASLEDQIYVSSKLNIRLTKTLNAWRNTFSAANHAMYLANTIPGKFISAFFLGVGQQEPQP